MTLMSTDDTAPATEESIQRAAGALAENNIEVVVVDDGGRRRVGGVERARATRIDEHPDHANFKVPGADLTIRGNVGAPRDRFVGWVYADPDGTAHHTVNCSIAQMKLTVERSGSAPLELATSHGAVYELGMRESDHGMAIQPFPDG